MIKARSASVTLTLILFLLIPMQGCADMFGFFNKQDVTLSLPVKGRLLNNGEPQQGVKVTRELIYGDTYIDEAISDSAGYFYFNNKKIRSSKPSNMFFNSSLLQSIYIENKKDEDSILWYTTIQFTEEQVLLSDILNNFECELTEEPITYDIPIKNTGQFYTVYTRCKL
ncbi:MULTISPECIES: transthyretin-like family protein [unclassified Pseudoalteromonas]|uniref:transthyretin-like family protein n=1 Tax=unclassified Pseudoalteromonas TaxID=194690 RepID=UPI001E5647C5|nr:MULTISPECIES: transthyretin-like family protein [unclassified Pseudoalteromonas]